jgi:hypothetical protein
MPRGKDKRLAYEARHGINKKEASRRRFKTMASQGIQEPEVRMK